MKVAVIADTHDNLPNINRALGLAKEKRAEAILHLGDIISPFAAKLFAGSGLRVIAIFGNNDGEKAGLSKILDITEPPRTVELAGRRIAMTHDIEKLPAEESGKADAVFFGHSHRSEVKREGGRPACRAKGKRGAGRLELNPGECGGWLYGSSSFAIVDLDTMEAELIGL